VKYLAPLGFLLPFFALNASTFAASQERPIDLVLSNGVALIDLPSALKLAGARSLDVKIAQEKLFEAKANRESAQWQFFPWLAPGLSYRRHEDLVQTVEGNIINTDKESYTVGPTLNAQVDLGDAIYKNLASKQLVKAAAFALQTQQQETLFNAAAGYFDLARAQASISVAAEAQRISREYLDQTQRAVDAGIAFKGDALRAQVQLEKNLLVLHQAAEYQQTAGARLAQILHLDSGLKLVTASSELLPLQIVNTNTSLETLIAKALASHPEIAQTHFALAAARDARKGVVYGPYIPTVGAQLFAGGLGGGKDRGDHTFGSSQDYQVTLGWRIGPGGLFDRGRIRAADARLNIAQLNTQKLADEIIRQVTEAHARVSSLAEQLATARRALTAADQSLRLTQQRKEFAIGAVLENIQSEQDLTRARLDYLTIVAEFNKAQYSLQRALGELNPVTIEKDRANHLSPQ